MSGQPTSTAPATGPISSYGAARRGTRNTTTANTAAGAASTSVAANPMTDGIGRRTAAAANAAAINHAGAVAVPAATASSSRLDGSVNSNHSQSGTMDSKAGGSTDSVIEELKALAKSMLEATNAARRRTSSIEHRNSYEALMHAIENRVNGDGSNGTAVMDAAAVGDAASVGAHDTVKHVDPTVRELAKPDTTLSAQMMEQLTDIPVELSPGSRVRQQQQLEQLQVQQQQHRNKPLKGRGAGAKNENTTISNSNNVGGGVAAEAVSANPAAQQSAAEAVESTGVSESVQPPLSSKAPVTKTQPLPVSRRPGRSAEPAEDEEEDDGTAYDGVRAQTIFKPVNRSAYNEVLASTWKPEALTRRVTVAEVPAKEKNSSSDESRSSEDDADGDDRHHHDDSDDDDGEEDEEDDDEAIATVATRNKARKASTALPTRAMKVYRVPSFPYGGGVTEQQARALQRQFDECIQSGEHLSSNAAGPALITKDAFDQHAYDEVEVETAQTDVKSFKPKSPYEFVVEVEREVRFDAVKAREERRRRFKRLVHENRAPATMGTFDLRVIMDPFKTGFEEEKNFPIVPGAVIAGRYEIIQMLGKATFSRAVRCYDLHDPIYDDTEEEEEGGEGENGGDEGGASASPKQHEESGTAAAVSASSPASPSSSSKQVAPTKTGKADEPASSPATAKKASLVKKRKLLGYGQVCLKIINNTKDFFDQALDEIRLLTLLNRQRDPDDAHIVRLIDAFYYKEHVMLVTELLRDTLYDYGKYNREEEEEFYFTVPRLRRLTRQIVEALGYVHSLNLIHTDLKPENIMFVSYSRCVVKVIDFGSSCFLSDHLSSYIQSRSYRAPEVVLGCDYDGRIDVWSLGAILVEMVTGDVLFTSDTVPEMLARIVYVCGTPFPRQMLWEGRHTSDYVNKFGCIYEYGGSADGQRDRGGHHHNEDEGEEPYCLYTPVPTMPPYTCNSSKKSKATLPRRKPAGPYSVLREKLAAANMVDEDFVSFVEACLTLDHKKRPTSAQLLDHPFIKNELL